MKDEHVNEAAQGVAEDMPQDVAQDLAFGARAARAPPAAAAIFVQLALRCGRNWAAQWHLARAVGKRFRGCRAKRLYVNKVPLNFHAPANREVTKHSFSQISIRSTPFLI